MSLSKSNVDLIRKTIEMEYAQQLQEHNIWLTVKSIVVVGFIASFLVRTELFLGGMSLAGIIILIADSNYNKTKTKLRRLRRKYIKIAI